MQIDRENSNDWLEILDEKKVRCIMLDPKADSTLLGHLESEPTWEVEEADDEFVFLTRNESQME